MAWKASLVHGTGENEKKRKDNDKIKNRSKRRAPVVGDGNLLSVSWPTGVEMLVFFCSSVLWRCRASDVSRHCFC